MIALPLLALLAVDFKTDVKPILDQKCAACHDRAFFLRQKAKIVEVIHLPLTEKRVMPPPDETPLNAKEKATLAAWVAEGLDYPDTVKPLQDDFALTKTLHSQIVKRDTIKTQAAMKPYKNIIPGTEVPYEMLPIPGGKFLMGTPESEPGHKPDESPQHTVAVEPFWMASHEVTWNEYRLFMFAMLAGETAGNNITIDAISRPTKPYVEMSFGMGIEGYPAISMTHHAANKYAQWLSAKTGHFYRLPTEAEWEYACRANAPAPTPLGDYAVYKANSGEKYAKVGTKKPNAWGLYDMLGNVMEWTVDQYDPKAYEHPQTWYPSKTSYPHTARGGGWDSTPDGVRCGARVPSNESWKMQDPNLPKSIWYHTDATWLGFRLVRPLKIPSAEEMHKFWNNGVAED
ncbi:formylglycine-generating enzyme family protein [Bryobacter aggregatus]|uniref:formylglycine-generating enzyme family protein n=1 Tax=Bryobacter aggregatus TaxID=360054 RepID=UPI0004E125E2|nr:SUMF1/EgtB/PvdO family nonheme iron enzyme [Bryobacter aggregatus]